MGNVFVSHNGPIGKTHDRSKMDSAGEIYIAWLRVLRELYCAHIAILYVPLNSAFSSMSILIQDDTKNTKCTLVINWYNVVSLIFNDALSEMQSKSINFFKQLYQEQFVFVIESNTESISTRARERSLYAIHSSRLFQYLQYYFYQYFPQKYQLIWEKYITV